MLPPKENGGVGVFVGLDRGEDQAEDDGQHQAPDQALAVVVDAARGAPR